MRSKDKPIESIGKNRKKPEFAFDDPHVKVWIKEKKAEKRKRNPRLTDEEFIQSVYKKIKVSANGKDDYWIDEDFLYIADGKIHAWHREHWDLEEFDWDDPKNKEWIESEERRMRKYWETKLKRMTEEEMDTMVDIKLALRKENPKLTSKQTSEIARKRVLAKRKNKQLFLTL